MRQFDLIESKTGTRVIIYNMITFSNGKTELDFKKVGDKFDICLSSTAQLQKPSRITVRKEFTSLREYLSILYYRPDMKMYIGESRVVTKYLEWLLYNPKIYERVEKLYKTVNRKEITSKLTEECNTTRNAIARSQTVITNKKSQHDRAGKRPNPAEEKKYLTEVAKMQQDLDAKKATLKNLERQLKLEETRNDASQKLQYLCGIYIDARTCEGIYVYNNDRLLMIRDNPKGVDFKGVVCLLNISYDVLEPSKHKNGFSNESEQRKILASINEIVCEYKETINIKYAANSNGDPMEFWRNLGYSGNMSDEASVETLHQRMRCQLLNGIKVQCVECGKWRSLGWCKNFVDRKFPDENWTCVELDKYTFFFHIWHVDWSKYFKRLL